MGYGDGYGGGGGKKPTPTSTTIKGAPAGYGGGYGGNSGGGGSSGGGSSSGGGGGSAPKQPKFNKKGVGKPAPQGSFDVESDLIRKASKLAELGTQKPHQRETIARYLRENLQGYTLDDINRMAAKAGIPEGVTQQLRANLPAQHGRVPVVGTVLDYIGRPAQAVEGGFSEAGPGQVFSVKGAWKGLTGQESYSPIQTVARSLGGQSRFQARKTEQSLNPAVRFGGNLALGAAYDPLTYLSFGTTAGSKAAIDATAEIVATERAAKAAEAGGQLLSKADTAATIRDAIRSVGAKKALSPEEYAALGPKVKRALRGARGGVKVAGKTVVPGKVFESEKLAAVRARLLNSTPASAVEDVGRTLPKARQAERAGLLPAGTTEDIASSLRRAQSTRTISNEDWLRLSKAGSKVTDPAVRLKLVNALEDPAKVASLSKDERKAFDVLNQIRYEKTAALQETGRLRGNVPTAVATKAPDLDAQARQVIGDWVHSAQTGDKAAAARLQLPPNDMYDAALQEAKVRSVGAAPAESYTGLAQGPMTTERYYPRVLSEASQKAGVQIEAPNPVALTGSTPGFARSREAAIRFEPTPSLIDKATGQPRFETDPFVAMYRHAAGVNADVARTRFIEDMRGIAGTDGAPIIQAQRDLPAEAATAIENARVNDVINGRVVKEVPIRSVDPATGEARLASQRVLVDKVLAHDPAFDRVMKVFADPAQSQDLLNFYDKAMQLWKSYATTFGPFSGGFGLRNFLGNQLNGYFLTGTSPTWQITAANELVRLRRGIAAGDPYKFLNASQEAEIREAFQTGVLDHGFYTGEMAGHESKIAALRPSEGAASKLKSVGKAINPLGQNALLRGGRAFNTSIEESARLGLFLAKRRGGFTPDTASRLVQKFLFDYGDLSRLDQGIKHVIPFWTWTRKNLPLQLEVLAKTPGAASFQAHLLDALRSINPNYDQAGLPQWARESDAVPFGNTAYVPDLPITSINDQLRPLYDAWKMRQSGPKDYQSFFRDLVLAAQPSGPVAGAAGVFTQQALGQDLFSGRKFKPGENVGPLPIQVEQPLEQLAPFGPGIAKIRGLADSSKRGQKILSGLTGIQTTPINKASRTNEQYRRAEELQRLIDWLAQQGIRQPTLKYIPTAKRKVPK